MRSRGRDKDNLSQPTNCLPGENKILWGSSSEKEEALRRPARKVSSERGLGETLTRNRRKRKPREGVKRGAIL